MSSAVHSATLAANNASSDLARLSSSHVRDSLSRIIKAWIFGAVFFQLTAGAVYASFARQLGVDERTYGFLAGIVPMMNFLQIPAARMLQKGWCPRRTMLVAGITSRMMWVVAASLPLWATIELLPRPWMLPGFVLCLVISSIFQAFSAPAFISWMSELIPGRVSPAFWSRRQRVGTIAAILAVVVGGAIADEAGLIKELTGGAIPPLILYSILLTFAAVCGVLDIAYFAGVHVPPSMAATRSTTAAGVSQPAGDATKTGQDEPALIASLLECVRDSTVRRYVMYLGSTMAGLATTGPLLWLHCLENFGWNRKETGLLLTVGPLIGVVIGSKFWGYVARTYGSRPVACMSALGMVTVPFAWLLATRDTYWTLGLFIMISGSFFAAYDLCHINFQTRSCPHLPRATVSAVVSIVGGSCFALAAFGAGAMAQWLDGWSIQIQGYLFTNYHLVFLFSLIPRLLTAFVFAPRLIEPESAPTRETMKELGQEFAQNMAHKMGRLFGARQE